MNKKISLYLILYIMILSSNANENKVQKNAHKNLTNKNIETAIIAGGCFWCTEAIYENVNGVLSVTSGYTGGKTDNPTYEDITSGKTGHAEAIKILFNKKIISYSKIIDLFWDAHDPTTLNRQGADIGSQYRSAIFYTSEVQKNIALASKNKAQKKFSSPIVTEINKLDKFYIAEKYHQDFLTNNPTHGYVKQIIKPKLVKFKKKNHESTKANQD